MHGKYKKVYIPGFNGDLRGILLNSLEWIDWHKIVKPNSRVFIKPNLTWFSYKSGVTTSSQVIEAVISILKSRTSNIIVGR